ncbi:DUF4328 domain-containing protein [Kitasatospora sp. NPDC056138]|uniref:DUF4328 domain-containing protein n=1 Tax=Kitasatospora sp. NPDC056138 TaxID=3345724 RepID=UPI0035D53767
MLCSNCGTAPALPHGRCQPCAAGYAPAPGHPPQQPSTAGLKSPRGTGIAASVLLGVCGFAALLALLAAFGLYRQADTDRLDLARAAVTVTGGLQVLMMAVTAVVFIIWFYRVRVNAEIFDPAGHRRGRGWSIGAWFTPVVFLWFPRQIAGDTWQASAPADPQGIRPLVSQAPVSLWWGAWIASAAVSRISGRLYGRALDADDFRGAAGMMAVEAVLDLTAAVLAILFVRKLTALQQARIAERSAWYHGAPSVVGSAPQPGLPV